MAPHAYLSGGIRPMHRDTMQARHWVTQVYRATMHRAGPPPECLSEGTDASTGGGDSHLLKLHPPWG